MRRLLAASLILGASALSGCGPSATITEAKDLVPLTQEEMRIIRDHDATVEDEERNNVRIEAPRAKAALAKTRSR